MARIAIDMALGSGFGLIRRRPGAVLLWGLVHVAVFVAAFGVMTPFYGDLFSQMAANAKLGDDASSQAAAVMMPHILAMEGRIWLLNIATLFVNIVVYCAVFRAVLHPEQSRFAYLRLGMPELLLFVLLIAAYFVIGVAAFIGILIAVALGFALGAAHAAAAGILLGLLAGVAAMVVLIWAALRFSMVGPMMVSDGKFHLFESWDLTKGHVAVLLVLALCIFAILFIVEMVVGGILLVVGMAMLAAAAGGLDNLTTFFSRPPSEIASGLAPLLVVGAVILTPVLGCFLAIMAAPWARAYLDLTAAEPEPVAS